MDYHELKFIKDRPKTRKEYQKRMNELRKILAQGISEIGEKEAAEKRVLCPYEIMLAMRYARFLSDTDVVNLRRGSFWENYD